MERKLSHHDSYIKGLGCIALKNPKRYLYANISYSIKFFVYGLYSEIWIYEEGIISNRKSARYGEIVKFTLYK